MDHQSDKMFYGKAPRQFLEDLGVDEDSLEGMTIQSLLRGMSKAAHRIESAEYWIKSNMEGVSRQFKRAAETGDLAGVHLNDLGELQGQANAYDTAVGAYAALSEQLRDLVEYLKRQDS
jgi:hypothetical protein